MTEVLRKRGPLVTSSRETPAPDLQWAEPGRVRVAGKFLRDQSDQKFYIKGVSYGAFRPDAEGNEYHDEDLIYRDFEQMAAAGFNTVHIPHTIPPRALLDIASEHRLKVMVGVSAEQYVGYLIDKTKKFSLQNTILRSVEPCAGHPALLCYGIGNEIQAPLARWIGRRRIERYLRRVARIVRDVDPDSLLTYVNYPSTEYLELPFLDFLSFNVYLEDREPFEDYLARLQILAGNQPLLVSELGLDSLRNGELGQAGFIDWQLQSVFDAGCLGAVIFSWTDEWYRGGGGRS